MFINRNFLKLWIGQAISAIGDRFTQMSLLAIVMILSADTGQKMAWVTFYSLLPFLLFGQLFGALADRIKRKYAMIAADILRAALVALIPFIRSYTDSFVYIYLIVFFVGTFSALFSPAKMAIIPNIVKREKLLTANSLVAGTGMIATLVGTLIAGYLIKATGVNASFFINAGTFLCSAIMVAGIFEPRQVINGREIVSIKKLFSDIKDGINFINRHQLLLELIQLSAVFSLLSSFFYITILNYSAAYLKLSTDGIGLLLALLGIGMCFGALWLGRRVGKLNYDQILIIGFLLIGISNFIFIAKPKFNITALLLLVIGGGGSLLLVTLDSLLQRTVPDSIRANVFGARGIVTNAIFLLSLIIIGQLIKNISSSIIFGLIGFISLSTGLFIYLSDKEITYQLLRGFLKIILKIWFQLKVTGLENIPSERKIILAGNHSSLMDGVVVMAAYPRRVYFLASERIFYGHTFSFLVRHLGFIPVKKGPANKEALQEAINLLERKRAICIFPEGKITEDGNLAEAKAGVAVLAQKGEATILPFAIEGAYEAWPVKQKKPKAFPVEIRFGKPIKEFGEKPLAELTEGVMEEVKKVKVELEKEGYLRLDPKELVRHIIYPR